MVIDYKCKDFSDPEKSLAYDEHCTQLAAYGRGLGWSEFAGVNLFIRTRVPGLIVAKIWQPDELQTGWEAFTCLLNLWRCRKGMTAPVASPEVP